MGSKVLNRSNNGLQEDRKEQAEALATAPDREEKSLQRPDFSDVKRR